MKEETEKIWTAIRELDKRIEDLEIKLSSRSENGILKEKMSIKKFIISKKPLDIVKLTLAVGYYLEKFEGMDNFNIKDLKNGFESAKEKLPSNMNRFVNLNVENNHMMVASKKKDKIKAWQLTNAGEEFIESI